MSPVLSAVMETFAFILMISTSRLSSRKKPLLDATPEVRNDTSTAEMDKRTLSAASPVAAHTTKDMTIMIRDNFISPLQDSVIQCSDERFTAQGKHRGLPLQHFALRAWLLASCSQLPASLPLESPTASHADSLLSRRWQNDRRATRPRLLPHLPGSML